MPHKQQVCLTCLIISKAHDPKLVWIHKPACTVRKENNPWTRQWRQIRNITKSGKKTYFNLCSVHHFKKESFLLKTHINQFSPICMKYTITWWETVPECDVTTSNISLISQSSQNKHQNIILLFSSNSSVELALRPSVQNYKNNGCQRGKAVHLADITMTSGGRWLRKWRTTNWETCIKLCFLACQQI